MNQFGIDMEKQAYLIKSNFLAHLIDTFTDFGMSPRKVEMRELVVLEEEVMNSGGRKNQADLQPRRSPIVLRSVLLFGSGTL